MSSASWTICFTQGYFADAHALLLEARSVIGPQAQYPDGDWTYAWPWAIYLMKTGDLSFVKENFSVERTTGLTGHTIVADRTGPGGIMESTDDIDTEGYWTTDDYEALTGLAAYGYLAMRIGDLPEATWATQQYDSLLSATNQTLDTTISRYGLDYLPCSILAPNSVNRCANPEDANWTSPFGFGDGRGTGLSSAPRSTAPAFPSSMPPMRTAFSASRAPFHRTPSVDSPGITTRAPTTPAGERGTGQHRVP